MFVRSLGVPALLLCALAIGCKVDVKRPPIRFVTPPTGGPAGGRASSGMSGGASNGGDGVSTGSGGDPTLSAGAGVDPSTGGMFENGGTAAMPMPPGGFDAGTDPNRNAVTPGTICERLATIQCAGEAACCANPGRDFETCKQTAQSGCTSQGMVDNIAQQSAAGFDAMRAEMVFAHLEDLSSQCDPGAAAYGVAPDGLRSMFHGTHAPNQSCQPLNMFDMAMSAGALASCENGDMYACLPALTATWICAPHAPAGSKCFTDVNCMPDLYCDNPKLSLSGSTCKARKNVGAACATGNECLTLFCRSNACQAVSVQAAYCLAGAQ